MSYKEKFLSVCVTLVVLLCAGQGFAETAFVNISAGSPKMVQAKNDARATLPMFLSHGLNARNEGLPQASVKVVLPVDSGKTEVIWVGPFRKNVDGTFTGMLVSDPQFLDKKMGNDVSFNYSQIADWSFWGKDQKLYGSYTTRVLLDLLPKDQANEIARDLSKEPLPKEWVSK